MREAAAGSGKLKLKLQTDSRLASGLAGGVCGAAAQDGGDCGRRRCSRSGREGAGEMRRSGFPGAGGGGGGGGLLQLEACWVERSERGHCRILARSAARPLAPEQRAPLLKSRGQRRRPIFPLPFSPIRRCAHQIRCPLFLRPPENGSLERAGRAVSTRSGACHGAPSLLWCDAQEACGPTPSVFRRVRDIQSSRSCWAVRWPFRAVGRPLGITGRRGVLIGSRAAPRLTRMSQRQSASQQSKTTPRYQAGGPEEARSTHCTLRPGLAPPGKSNAHHRARSAISKRPFLQAVVVADTDSHAVVAGSLRLEPVGASSTAPAARRARGFGSAQMAWRRPWWDRSESSCAARYGPGYPCLESRTACGHLVWLAWCTMLWRRQLSLDVL